MLTQARVRYLFRYDGITGRLFWRVRDLSDFKSARAQRSWNSRFAGKPAGGINGKGYVVVSIDNASYQAHRVIWLYVHGVLPTGEVDHEKGNKAANLLLGMRDVPHSENVKNAARRKDNTSGVVGVYWYRRTKRWRAEINDSGKKKYLGSFGTKVAAITCRKLAERDLGFHPNHGREKQD